MKENAKHTPLKTEKGSVQRWADEQRYKSALLALHAAAPELLKSAQRIIHALETHPGIGTSSYFLALVGAVKKAEGK